jgi:uncharacterized protein YbjQ (UPF0145 family)
VSPLFRRGAAADPAALERAEESLRRLEQGGIPLPASERLAALADSAAPFGSDLGVAEYALLERLGIVPVTLVMGSSIYHVGWQTGMGYTFAPGELEVLSGGYNECRRIALGRLLEEAATCGADAVVGVRIQQGGHDWAPGAVEFIAVGTAVRLPTAMKTERTVLTDLSGQDYWKLHSAGLRPVGIAADTSVHYVVASWQTQMAQGGGMFAGGWANQELRDFTQGVYAARERAMSYLSVQAREQGGDGVVGVKIDQRAQPHRVAGLGYEREDLIVTFNVIGTVVREESAGELEPARGVLALG